MEVNGQLHAPATLPMEKKTPGTRGIGSWIGLGVSIDILEKRK